MTKLAVGRSRAHQTYVISYFELDPKISSGL